MSDKRLQLKNDFSFYARNCLQIRTKVKGLQFFNLNSAQEYIHERLEKQIQETGKVRAIILKGRQQGVSTYVGGRFIHKVTHNKGVRAFILTHDGESTNALFEMTERYYDNLPSFVKPVAGTANAKELHFNGIDSGYKIGTAGNKAVGRGQTLQYFHGSEVAFWMNASEHTKGIMQAVPDAKGTEVVWESTANGVGNFFHQQWKAAEKGLSEFEAIFIPWFWQYEYVKDTPEGFTLSADEEVLAKYYELDLNQMYWRRVKIIELTTDGIDGEKAFKQEYPMNAAEAFQVSGGDGLITSSHCIKARREIVAGSGAYVVGVDPSRGGDRFAIVRRHGRLMFGMQAYKGDECDSLGKNVAICKKILDTEDPDTNKIPDMMFIDYGSGADLVDRLHELGYKSRVKSVHFGSTPLNPEKYTNKRNEIWQELSDWLVDESLPVQIPDDDEMQADLCASPFSYDSKDRRVLWRKERIKEKYGFSPDYGDAAALTFAEPVRIDKVKRKLKYKSNPII